MEYFRDRFLNTPIWRKRRALPPIAVDDDQVCAFRSLAPFWPAPSSGESSSNDTTPMARLLVVKSVGRDKPTLEFLEKAFMRRIDRKARRSDATITIAGVGRRRTNR